MNAFKQLNGRWVIATTEANAATGSVLTVTKRNGETQTLTLGMPLGSGTYGTRLFAIAPAARAPAAAAEAVGDLTPIMALFNRARAHLKYPAIVLDGFRVSIAGARAAHPGSLNVTGIEKHFNAQRGRDERTWFGRVTLDGSFAPSRSAPADLADKLRAFAADPAGVAAAFGHLHGACCFCMRALSDDRSTAVGYGPICADHYGLPWGEAPAEAAPVAERDLGTARGTAQSRARRRAREDAARLYPQPERDCTDPDCRVCEVA
jgi:hypothetical protein